MTGRALREITRRGLPAAERYATPDDFQRIFAMAMTDLFRLALLLTADAEEAERSLILAMRDCFDSGAVSREWAHIWARRAVVRKAIERISSIKGAPPAVATSERGSRIDLLPREYPVAMLPESLAILDLPDFERLVFVICTLEHFSTQDCALLLGRSLKDVRGALARATDTIVSSEERRQTERSESCRAGSRGAWGGACVEQNGACGTLLD